MSVDQIIMNAVIFGAGLYKKLYQGEISKENAISEIKNLSSELSDVEAPYLLKRVMDKIPEN